ncbi:cell wall-binding repeat-containing protein [Clostridium sp. 'White wine YQ']|uniref:cell wall-binding repeat-containing protein n=1 Tax=Clostridium sp. 'White wine YQ' TaxID=3027474 RepID=UPI00236512EA|nr:cell wall-binding repeat-containing protein [Clostridium sp. 'White wine YQ']MDD7792732.1 cell wall-binding repeat-containing protein [Clostridium sp. 'White wine YQ']
MRKFTKIYSLSLVAFLLLNTRTTFASDIYENKSVSINSSNKVHDDVIWDNETKGNEFIFKDTTQPICTYKGPNGVEIRSYSSAYNTIDKLMAVYNELLKNTIGPEVSYLSHIDLIGDYPMGAYTAGVWHGMYEEVGGVKRLAKDRYIELFGCDTVSFQELAGVLSHEYGHQFTNYYLLLKEGKLFDDDSNSYNKVRNLSSYSSVNSGYHEWNPAEMAAEDYKQLYGSTTGKNIYEFKDIKDRTIAGDQTNYSWNSLMYNIWPQENIYLPLASQANNLYNYWVSMSGKRASNEFAPTMPLLTVTDVTTFPYPWGGTKSTVTLSWTSSADDNTDDLNYAVVCYKGDINNPGSSFYYGVVKTSKDSTGRTATIGTYKYGDTYGSDGNLDLNAKYRVLAMDKDGKVVASKDISIDPNNLANLVTKIPNRISGIDRYKTAVNISNTGWTSTSDTVILATGDDFPDALSAAPLAKKYNAPILLTENNTLSESTKNEINRLKPKNIIIVGGIGAVSSGIENQLVNSGYNCRRISGIDRYSTSLSIAKEIGNVNEVVLATGEDYPDALSIASYAASRGIPIILTGKNSIPQNSENYIKSLNISKTYVVGATGVVSDNAIRNMKNIVRLGGTDRYDTNRLIVNYIKPLMNLNQVYVATGLDFPDALAGSVLASSTSSPILLADKINSQNAKSMISTNSSSVKSVNVLGGVGVVDNDILKNLISN